MVLWHLSALRMDGYLTEFVFVDLFSSYTAHSKHFVTTQEETEKGKILKITIVSVSFLGFQQLFSV